MVWRPRAFLPSPFAVLHTKGKLPVKVGGEGGKETMPFLLPNVAEVLSEFRRLGEGLVEEVVVL